MDGATVIRGPLPYAGARRRTGPASGAGRWLWAARGLRSPDGFPLVLAAGGGPVPALVALVAQNALFREEGGIAALVLLLAGLVGGVGEARDAAVRGAVTDCVVVGEIRATHHPTFGEGAPHPKTLYLHTLDCDGGRPGDFSAEERIAEPGGTVRIADDPAGRMDPVPEHRNRAHGSPVLPAALLVLSTALTVVTLAAEGRAEDRRS